MKNQFLVGEKIYLRPIEESDLNEKYQSWLNNPEVTAYNTHHRFPNYRQNMLDYFNEVIKSKNNLILGIIDKETDEHIGNAALENIDPINKSAEFAILIGEKKMWGKGIGKEVLKLLVEHGFNALNLNRIYMGTSADNIGMQKVAEAVGFKKEGVGRQVFYKNGEYKDTVNYGLLRSEYNGKK
ncbi:MAG: GNAT family protein [Candidatus Pacebacteria bacterium]|nr:GNAT family protein [Candidatus Paceibacterota bacterium]